jgi:hypothetical protein
VRRPRLFDGPAVLPWRRPRREALLLGLVAVTALTQVYPPNTQDISRLCLTKALTAGRLTTDGCIGHTVDRSSYGGHLYSNKAPGMSVLELPAAVAVRLPEPEQWVQKGDLRLWAVRLVAAGVPYLLCLLAVGRIAEGLAPGFGGAVLVTLGLGTLMGPLGVACFDHIPAAALGFLAFVLAWRRNALAAGLLAGAALTTEFEAAAVLLTVLAYTALQGGRAALRYAVGTLPGIVLLGAYDWAAFGAPWHTPLHYSLNEYTAAENSGLLGVHLPTAHATRLVFVGDRGLLLTSPVLVAAALGLLLLWRRGLRAEALTCAVVSIAFVVAECGYFIPYGGTSPGPRFLVPALPFLAVGLGPAFARWRATTTVLAAISVVANTALLLTWASASSYRQTVWGEIARVPTERGSSRLAFELSRNVLVWGQNRIVAAVLVCGFAAATFLIALPSRRAPGR